MNKEEALSIPGVEQPSAPDSLCTPEQRANLAKLAAFLRTLPDDDKRFGMRFFHTRNENTATKAHPCGSVSCAVGWGPAAGIKPKRSEFWSAYSERVFVYDIDAWQWLFSSDWGYVDNTATGAASRIEWFLAHGLPGDASSQRRGEAPLCYRPSSAEQTADEASGTNQ